MRGGRAYLLLPLLFAFVLPAAGERPEGDQFIDRLDPQSTGVDSGGPDAFGYRWISSNDPGGPVYNWIDITGVGIGTGAGNGWNSGLLSILPSPLWFYGNSFTSMAICDDGWVSFTDGSSFWHPDSLPDTSGYFNCIAALATNIDPGPGGGGEIYYWVDGPNNRTVVEWFNTPQFGVSDSYTFEIIIDCSDSTVLVQYDNATNWTAFPAAIGIQNSDGTIGLTFPQDSLADSLAVKFYWVAPDSNVGTVSIDYPNDAILLQPSVPCTAKATVQNFGTSTVSFDVICEVDIFGLVVFADTQVVSNLAGDSTARVQFPGWVPGEFIDYTVTVTTLLTGDPFPSDDSQSRRAKAPGPYYEELRWDSGTMGQFYYYTQYDSVMAAEFFPSLYPALVKYVAIYLLSEGDAPYWPYPDSTHDSVGVGIWFDQNGDTIPETLVYADTIVGDSIPPSWVYGIPPDSLIINDGHLWVGVNNLPGGGEEALGTDEVTDYPEYKWGGSYAGVWYRQDLTAGDHMIRAYVSPAVEHDVGAVRIISPGTQVVPNIPVACSAGVGNFSINQESFLVYCLVDSAGIHVERDSATVWNLPPFDSTQVEVGYWTPNGVGNSYDIIVYTALAGDQNPRNDTVRGTTYTFEEVTEIPCGCAFSAPTIDGFIDAGEWRYAFKVDMSNIYGRSGAGPYPPGCVYAYAMNDTSYLYLAFDCIRDSTYENTDNPGIFLDDNRDRQWPAYPDTSEGQNTWQPGIRWASRWFCQGSAGGWRSGRPFTMEVSISSGRMQFEGAIPLGDSVDPAYLDAAMGDTVGVFLKYYDASEGHEGWWPQDSDTIEPVQFGDIILAMCPGVEELPDLQFPASSFQLCQNYPNPFTRTTTIAYSLPSAVGGLRRAQSSRRLTAVRLSVYDLSGRLVRTLVDELQVGGFYSVEWDGRDVSGREAASGVYFYRIRTGEFESTRRMVLLR